MTGQHQIQGRPQTSFFHDLASVASTRIAVLAMSISSGVLIARFIGAEGKGLVAALTVVPTVIVTFSELGVRQSTVYLIGRKAFPIEEIAATLATLFFLASATSILFCFLYFRVTWLPQYTWFLVAMAALAAPAKIAQNYAAGVFLGAQRISHFNRAGWAAAATRLAFILALVGALGYGTRGVLAAELIAASGMALYAVHLVAKVAPVRFAWRSDIARRLTRLGLAYALALFTITVLYKINIVLLQRLSTLEELGVYSLGANLGEYIWQIPATIMGLLFSRGANAEDPAAFTSKVLVLFRVTLIIAAAAAGAVAFAGPILIPLVYGPDFARSGSVLAAILPGVVAFAGYKILNTDLNSRGKPKIALYMSVPALAINVGLGFMLIPRFGAMGAAAAASITYGLAAALYLVIYCRALNLKLSDALRYRRSDLAFVIERTPLRRFRRSTASQ